MGNYNKRIDGEKMLNVQIQNKGLQNEYFEIVEQEEKKRNITAKEVDDILLGLEEQKAYWLSVKTKTVDLKKITV